MNLETNGTEQRYFFVQLGILEGLYPINSGLQMLGLRANLVIIPIFALQDFLQLAHIRFHEHLVPAGLVIERSPPLRIADVTLVSRHLEMIRNALAADLNTAIDEPFGSNKLEFQPKYEIRVAPLSAKKLVVRHFLLQRAAHESPVRDPPGLGCVAL